MEVAGAAKNPSIIEVNLITRKLEEGNSAHTYHSFTDTNPFFIKPKKKRVHRKIEKENRSSSHTELSVKILQ